MSDVRFVCVREQKFAYPYVAFEQRRYFGPELISLAGQKVGVRKSQASGNIIIVISPDGKSEFQLHARPFINANLQTKPALRRFIASDSDQTLDALRAIKDRIPHSPKTVTKET